MKTTPLFFAAALFAASFTTPGIAEEGAVEESQEGAVEESQEGAVGESQEGAAEESQEGAVEESQEGEAEESQEGEAVESQEGEAVESQEGAVVESQEGEAVESQEGAAVESQEGAVEESRGIGSHIFGNTSLVLKVGTLGSGGELKYKFHPRITGRLTYAKFNLPFDDTDDGGNQFNGEVDFRTLGLIADLHPFASGFRLSAGLVSNGNAIRASANGQFTYENQQYDGNVNVLLDFKSASPYYGLGWSSQNDGLSFDFDFGALVQGPPMLSINGEGIAGGRTGVRCTFRVDADGVVSVTDTANVCPRLGADLTTEHTKFRDDVKDFKIWPVISFGLHYRF